MSFNQQTNQNILVIKTNVKTKSNQVIQFIYVQKK